MQWWCPCTSKWTKPHTHSYTHIHTGINIFSQSQLIAAIAIIKGNLNLQVAIWGQTLYCDTSVLPDTYIDSCA